MLKHIKIVLYFFSLLLHNYLLSNLTKSFQQDLSLKDVFYFYKLIENQLLLSLTNMRHAKNKSPFQKKH